MMKLCKALLFLPASIVMLTVACGGGSGSGSSTTSTTGGSGGGSSTIANSTPLIVDAGPASLASAQEADEDLAFITITICVPGTTTCQSIDHVQVDTGSEGLRIPAEVLSLSLPQQTASGNQVSECTSFADQTFIWGPVDSADIQIAGEVAKSVPVQIASTAVPPAAASGSGCNPDQTGQVATVAQLGANAIIGVGLFRQDCGFGCANSATNGLYFGCASSTCNSIAEPLTAQVQNPVWMFPQDNNGVIVELPSVSGNGQLNAVGQLIFGIGTQSDNAIGSAVALQPDTSTGEFGAQFNGVTYNDFSFSQSGHGSSFIDSGSNGIFFLDSQTLVNSGFPIPDCSGSTNLQGFYCPGNPQQLTVNLFSENSNTGTIIGGARPVQFTIENASVLFQSNFSAFNDVGGPSPPSAPEGFDLGLAFFFGKNIYFGIEGQNTPFGAGPVYAF